MIHEDSITDREAVQSQLERILHSHAFAGATRSQEFLRYVVDRSLSGSSSPIKEYSIALDVFHRDVSYDPMVDATVRVEAGRLRHRLHDYYTEEGREDTLVIEIPKGGYRASITERGSGLPVPSLAPPSVTAPGAAPLTRPRPRWLLLASAAALAAVLLVTFLYTQHRLPAGDAQAASPGSLTLAVLPFTNHSGDAGNDYIADGLTSDLIRQFSEFPPLRVLSRNAAERLRASGSTSASVAQILLTGELRRDAEGRLTVNTELSRSRDGSLIDSRQYLPEQNDLRPVQADIVRDVARNLKLDLDPRDIGPRRLSTSDPIAFQDYLRGISAAQGVGAADLHTAIGFFQQALQRDPRFALAWVSLADCHILLALFFEPPREHMPVARSFLEKALVLDSSSPEAHGGLGIIRLVYDWNYEAAQAELSATSSRESAAFLLGCTSHLLEQTGNFRNAEETINRMLEFDPRSPMLISELGCINYYGGRYADAVRYYREALQSDPRSPVPYWGLGKSLAQLGSYPEALNVLRRFRTVNGFEPPLITSEIGYVEGRSGDVSAARRTLRQLVKSSHRAYVDPFLIALVSLSLGDDHATYTWLNRAFDVRSPFLISITSDPKWSSRQKDPRLQAILSEMARNRDASATSISQNLTPSLPAKGR